VLRRRHSLAGQHFATLLLQLCDNNQIAILALPTVSEQLAKSGTARPYDDTQHKVQSGGEYWVIPVTCHEAKTVNSHEAKDDCSAERRE
jgi:hypothetical protein